jgi:sugar phosphate isomerase/epimerase
MKRREFVQQSALAGGILLANPMDLMKVKARHIGIQLYSVRDVADKDPAGTLQQLAAMGYKEVEGHQYANGKFYSFPPSEFKTVLHDAGIKMTSAHTGIGMDHLDGTTLKLNDLAKKTIDDHAEIGVCQLICPYIPEEQRTLDRLRVVSDLFNQYGEACKKAGMTFGYHNHDFDFKKIGQTAIIDHILGHSDPELVKWEMDLYWVRYAFEDPIKWVNNYPGRISAFHVKDMANASGRESIEVGDGVIDFETVFNLPSASGVKYYIVELEHYRTTSMEGAAISLRNLKPMLGKA